MTGRPGTALVRRPGPRVAEGIVTHVERRPVDAVLAYRQHDAYIAALAAAGWRIHPVDAADDLPDAPFVEDTVVVCGDLAVLARPGVESRVPEVAGTEKAVRDLGLDVCRVEPPGTLEGGDVLQVGDTVYVGRSARTDHDAICQLGALLNRRVVAVDVRGCLHLKSAMTALPDGSLIGLPDLVDTTVLPYLQVVPEPTGAHVVVLGDDHALLAASAPRTAALLRSDGYQVTTVDISEFEALDGCVTCLSVLVPGR
ncbi:N(G),N(G)-dimethylarginine dimethylaminohydrolase [Actinomadura craniellae]|uniref:N(G),N(G)-dimethylarginine dimethylaminohydrolase n=1 Tax=Actinomadura craniellae TaxID=2231787 RepID=A0A365GYZ9_9ACTN|nr:dimethylargininase [Actinomadura craniellae]RAY12065.1 N(G),N(G)-dimethylarginine dimethylaminohydrolase [Actinomadura craniellae]